MAGQGRAGHMADVRGEYQLVKNVKDVEQCNTADGREPQTGADCSELVDAWQSSMHTE